MLSVFTAVDAVWHLKKVEYLPFRRKMHSLVNFKFILYQTAKLHVLHTLWSGFSLLQSWNVTIMHRDIATSTRKWYILKPEFKPSFPSFSLLLVSLVHSSPPPSVRQRNVFSLPPEDYICAVNVLLISVVYIWISNWTNGNILVLPCKHRVYTALYEMILSLQSLEVPEK